MLHLYNNGILLSNKHNSMYTHTQTQLGLRSMLSGRDQTENGTPYEVLERQQSSVLTDSMALCTGLLQQPEQSTAYHAA